jgi:hypothetical protein
MLRVKDPAFACRIIKACTALHNYLIARRAPNDDFLENPEEQLHGEDIVI